MKGETGSGAGILGVCQSCLRRNQDLPITIKSHHDTVWTDGLRYLYRVTTSPNRSINDHESTAEFEDRQHRLQQHWQVQRGPIPVRFAVVAASIRANAHCATSLDHPTAATERAP